VDLIPGIHGQALASVTLTPSRGARRRRRARAVAAAAGRLASGLRVPALPTGFAGPAHAA
jgi:hypothetical protein